MFLYGKAEANRQEVGQGRHLEPQGVMRYPGQNPASSTCSVVKGHCAGYF
jgi:hypothetical protein